MTLPIRLRIMKNCRTCCRFGNVFQQRRKTFIHPIIKGIILHFMLAYFHPFVDGNGRTARSLFYWYMLKKGYWLVEYMSISRTIYKTKRNYEKAYLYTEYDDNDLTYFILYNLRTMKKAFEELKIYETQIGREQQHCLDCKHQRESIRVKHKY